MAGSGATTSSATGVIGVRPLVRFLKDGALSKGVSQAPRAGCSRDAPRAHVMLHDDAPATNVAFRVCGPMFAVALSRELKMAALSTCTVSRALCPVQASGCESSRRATYTLYPVSDTLYPTVPRAGERLREFTARNISNTVGAARMPTPADHGGFRSLRFGLGFRAERITLPSTYHPGAHVTSAPNPEQS